MKKYQLMNLVNFWQSIAYRVPHFSYQFRVNNIWIIDTVHLKKKLVCCNIDSFSLVFILIKSTKFSATIYWYQMKSVLTDNSYFTLHFFFFYTHLFCFDLYHNQNKQKYVVYTIRKKYIISYPSLIRKIY